MREGLPEEKLAEIQETLSTVADATGEVTELRDETGKAAEEAVNRAAESNGTPDASTASETDFLAAAKQFGDKQADLEQAQAGVEDSCRELQVNLEEAAATGRVAPPGRPRSRTIRTEWWVEGTDSTLRESSRSDPAPP